MDISKFYNKFIKEDGFIIIDANLNKNTIGKPKKENPITIKLLDKRPVVIKTLLLSDKDFIKFPNSSKDGFISL